MTVQRLNNVAIQTFCMPSHAPTKILLNLFKNQTIKMLLVFAFEYLLCWQCLDRLKSRFTFGPFCFSYTEFASRQVSKQRSSVLIEFIVTTPLCRNVCWSNCRIPGIIIKLNYLDVGLVASIYAISLGVLANYFKQFGPVF